MVAWVRIWLRSIRFAISQKLGLPQFIIEDAKEKLSQTDISFEDLLTDLEKKRIHIEKEELEPEHILIPFELVKGESVLKIN